MQSNAMNSILEFRLSVNLVQYGESELLQVELEALPENIAGPRLHIPHEVDIGHVLAAPLQDEESLGQALYHCLFVGEKPEHRKIGAAFSECRKHLFGLGVRLRLILFLKADPSTPSRLFSFPWELLHDGSEWLAADPRLSIVRALNVRESSLSPIASPYLRVLLAHASPPDKPVFVVDRFSEIIEHELQSIKPLECETLPHAQRTSLHERIQQGVDIIHFLGHGHIDSDGKGIAKLSLEHNESPVSDDVSATELVEWIRNSRKTPRLFVLTACHSGHASTYGFLGIASGLLDAGVEAVVAMQTEIYLDEAREFAREFYRALANRRNVDDAVYAARNVLTRRCHRRVDDHLNQLLDAPPQPKTIFQYPKDWNIPAQTKPSGFPGWAVPILFLRGDGWLGQQPPPPSISWKAASTPEAEMICIFERGFYIDKFPVTRREYRRFARATGRLEPRQWQHITGEMLQGVFRDLIPESTKDTETAWGDSTYVEGLLPATYVTLDDASAYASWAGKRIPTPEEWREAAMAGREDPQGPYPWGADMRTGYCNTRERGYGSPWPVLLAELVYGTDQHVMCDVVGNVAEWTCSPDGQAYLSGGSFNDPLKDCSVQKHWKVLPTLSNAGIGFRCLVYWRDVPQD
jgi:formylglycine-generating enzyme required for sulfatase activity